MMDEEQQGYASYLVLVVCSLLFILLFMVATSFHVQSQLLHYRENEIRGNYLILSGLALWLAEEGYDGELVPTRSFLLEEGRVTVTLEEEREEEAVLNLLAEVKESQVKRKVKVSVSLKDGSIIRWQEM